MNGLDLFSGIGGITMALSEWVRPVAYCEIDTYCQGVLFSRMATGDIPTAPIWNDITSFPIQSFAGHVDIIYGGFPCQDISVAGHGKGLAGERSGLFFEIMRLVREIQPTFVFLENVPAIRTRGLDIVLKEFTQAGYDCRWTMLSASDLGAPHKRERWFLLARRRRDNEGCNTDSNGTQFTQVKESQGSSFIGTSADRLCENASHSESIGVQTSGNKVRIEKRQSEPMVQSVRSYWKEVEPPLCGVDDGLQFGSQRIGALGNSVVPQQAKAAFEALMGIKA